MTFWLIAAGIGAALLGFGFWRGRRYERASRAKAHGGYLPFSSDPDDWFSPRLGITVHDQPHPLQDRIRNKTAARTPTVDQRGTGGRQGE